MYFFQFATYLGAASQTTSVTRLCSVLITHLLGVQEDLPQAGEGEVREAEGYSCSVAGNCFGRAPSDGSKCGNVSLTQGSSSKNPTIFFFFSEVGQLWIEEIAAVVGMCDL